MEIMHEHDNLITDSTASKMQMLLIKSYKPSKVNVLKGC